MSQKPKVRNIGDRFVRRERYIEGVRLTAMVVAPNGTEQPSAPSRHSYTEARDDMLAALEMDRADEKQRAITEAAEEEAACGGGRHYLDEDEDEDKYK